MTPSLFHSDASKLLPVKSLNQSILLTIDVEDWFQVENFSSYIQRSQWDKLPTRVVQNTHAILDLLQEKKRDIKATFFVLGWIAERFPDLIREISKRGHEIASHGFDHAMCTHMTADSLLSDLIRSKNVIEEITGTEVKGYRAPSFSISDDALRLIRKAGYGYDSSFNSFTQHGRYGFITTNGYPKRGIAIRIASDFYELPISNLEFGGQTIPWGGGGYFRFFPFSIFKKGIQRILSKQQAYMFYMHPWEIDPEQPRVKRIKGISAFRHYVNLERTIGRLSRMITAFKHGDFITCGQYLKAQNKISGVRS
jgi:polysaccharide deacetylase family protein (PEP-CTERM system associated)